MLKNTIHTVLTHFVPMFGHHGQFLGLATGCGTRWRPLTLLGTRAWGPTMGPFVVWGQGLGS